MVTNGHARTTTSFPFCLKFIFIISYMHGRKLDRRISVFDPNRKLVADTLVEKRQ